MENITPIVFAPALTQGSAPATAPRQVGFDRHELGQILNLYGRMVSAGLWRDYAIDMLRDEAVFSAFRRASERPEYQIVKRPELARKQGAYALVSQAGGVLRRGQELAGVLKVLERKLIKLVEA